MNEEKEEMWVASRMAKIDKWFDELATEIHKRFSTDGKEYIQQTGVECWLEMYRDGLSPSDAAAEEACAAASMLG